MSTTDIRKELHTYINKADDRMLHLLYAMVQADMDEDDHKLTEDHKRVLDERLDDHMASPQSGATWEEVKSRIESRL